MLNLENKRAWTRKRDGIGDNEPVLFYGYKEPLLKFKEGFGFRGVLSYSKDKDKVQCHFCGLLFRGLTKSHLQLHKLTASEYKEKTGLAPTTALIGEGLREKFMARPRNLNYTEAMAKAREVQKKKIKSGELKSGSLVSWCLSLIREKKVSRSISPQM